MTSTSVTPGSPQQRFERPGADVRRGAAPRRRRAPWRRRPGDPASRRATRDPVRGQLTGIPGQPVAYGVDKGSRHRFHRHAHAAASSVTARACASTSRRGPAEPPTRRAHRAEAEVDRLLEPALVGHRGDHRHAGHPADLGSAPARRRGAPAAARRWSGNRAQSRAADATPATLGTTTTSSRSHRGRDLVDQRVGRPRQVDHDGVVTAPSRRQRLAGGERLQAPRTRRRTRTGRRAAPRRGSASRSERALSRPVVWHSASQRKPSCARDPAPGRRPGRAGRSRSTTASPDRAAVCPSAHARVVAPAPPDPPTTPITSPRRAPASPRSVSVSTSQVSEPRQLGDVPAPRREGRAEQLVGRPRRAPRCAPARGASGSIRAISAARSAPTSTSGAAVQERSAVCRSGATSGVTPAAAPRRSSSSSRVSIAR